MAITSAVEPTDGPVSVYGTLGGTLQSGRAMTPRSVPIRRAMTSTYGASEYATRNPMLYA
jgi:hypothetical protein